MLVIPGKVWIASFKHWEYLTGNPLWWVHCLHSIVLLTQVPLPQCHVLCFAICCWSSPQLGLDITEKSLWKQDVSFGKSFIIFLLVATLYSIITCSILSAYLVKIERMCLLISGLSFCVSFQFREAGWWGSFEFSTEHVECSRFEFMMAFLLNPFKAFYLTLFNISFSFPKWRLHVLWISCLFSWLSL